MEPTLRPKLARLPEPRRLAGPDVLWRSACGVLALGALLGGLYQAVVAGAHLAALPETSPAAPPSVLTSAQSGIYAAKLRAADLRLGIPAARVEAGLMLVHQAFDDVSEAARTQALRDGIADLERGVARAPANAAAWHGIAVGHYRLGEPAPALAALRMSQKFAPYEPALAFQRAEIGLGLFMLLNEQDRLALATDIRCAFRTDLEELTKLALRDTWSKDYILAALPDDPERVATLKRIIASKH